MSSRNINEAVAAAQELLIPGFAPSLVRIGIDKAFDSADSGEQNAIAGLIVDLTSRGCFNSEDVSAATEEFIPDLEDISLDVPAAPRVLGLIIGGCADKGVFGLDILANKLPNIEGAEPRRNVLISALKNIKDVSGEDKMVALAKQGGLDVLKLCEHDVEFEPHLSDAKSFIQEEGLAALI